MSEKNYLKLNSFWENIEEELGVEIPIYLKNITRLNGFDNYLSLKGLTDEHITLMETYAREEMKLFIGPNDDLKDFYDKYYICTDKFRISPGHRILLNKVREYLDSRAQENLLKNNKVRNSNKMNKTKHTPSRAPSTDMNMSLSSHSASTDALSPSKDLDLIGEQSMLFSQLRAIINKYIEKYNSSDLKRVPVSFCMNSIEVEIRENYDNDGSFTYCATVVCPICNTNIKVHKMPYGKQLKQRWIYSNVERHFKSYHDGNGNKKRDRINRQPAIDRYLTSNAISELFTKRKENETITSRDTDTEENNLLLNYENLDDDITTAGNKRKILISESESETEGTNKTQKSMSGEEFRGVVTEPTAP